MKRLFLLFSLTYLTCILGCATTKINSSQSDSFVAPGIGVSMNPQTAYDKALLAARTEIARQIQIQLDSEQRQYNDDLSQNNEPISEDEYTAVTKSAVSLTLKNVRPIPDSVKRKQRNGKYECEVICECPKNSADEALLTVIRKKQDVYTRYRASEAFREFESRIESGNQ
jgi:hypothetical protein